MKDLPSPSLEAGVARVVAGTDAAAGCCEDLVAQRCDSDGDGVGRVGAARLAGGTVGVGAV